MSYTNLSQNHLSRLYLTMALLVFLGALVWINVRVTPSQQSQQRQRSVAVAFSYDGSITLQTSDKINQFTLEQPFEILVYADSENNPIVGYDVILGFGEDNIEIDRVESLLSDFTVYPFKQDEYHVATGVKSISSKENTIFSNTPILKVTARGIKQGSTTISVLNTVESRKTQLVDDKTQILYPKGADLILTIE